VDYLAVRNAEKMSKAYFEDKDYGFNGGPDSGRIAAVPVIMALALLLATLSSGCSVMYNRSVQQRMRTECVFEMAATRDGEFRVGVDALNLPGAWAALKEEPVTHLGLALVDGAALYFGNKEYRKDKKERKQRASIHIENHGHNSRFVITEGGAGSAGGDSNTGLGGQDNQ
jgi:hypothetical protein